MSKIYAMTEHKSVVKYFNLVIVNNQLNSMTHYSILKARVLYYFQPDNGNLSSGF